MQDSTPGWARYIEDLETQAARLPRRRRVDPAPPEVLAPILGAVCAGAIRLVARLCGGRRRRRPGHRPDIDG
jgi:hypothetical protein